MKTSINTPFTCLWLCPLYLMRWMSKIWDDMVHVCAQEETAVCSLRLGSCSLNWVLCNVQVVVVYSPPPPPVVVKKVEEETPVVQKVHAPVVQKVHAPVPVVQSVPSSSSSAAAAAAAASGRH